MPVLTPKLASNMANDVYDLVKSDSFDFGFEQFKHTYGSIANLDKSNVIKSKTGAVAFIKSRTAFGLCFIGKGSYQGHAFIILRGTKFLADWLTNLNVGVSRSVNGQSVHDGFNQAFKTMQPQLAPFVSGLISNNIHSIHCIGHSLGGALATLCAEHIQLATKRKPYLYTFGAPRVGLRDFADTLSVNLWPENIYRVYHRTDIVPCIPFWPFIHAPTKMSAQYDYYQPSPGDFPSGEYHSMAKYVSTVGGLSWSALRSRRAEMTNNKNIEQWILHQGSVNFSVTNLNWLDKAINYVLAKTISHLGGALTVVSGSTFTLMDRLSYILAKGIDISESLSGLVLGLIVKIMKMLGLNKALTKADMTRGFIRSVFERLNQRIQAYCRRVLDSALVDGRSS